MPKYDESRAECWVLTYKEGLFSTVAHDLRLRVARFEIEVDDARTRVSAEFDPSSLYVDTAMKDGAPMPSALSAADKQKIAQQLRDDVLHVAAHPRITFHSRALRARSDGGYDVEGELCLHGVTRSLRGSSRGVGERQELEVTLHQPDYGIAPFRALLGTLKVQSDVRVRLVL